MGGKAVEEGVRYEVKGKLESVVEFAPLQVAIFSGSGPGGNTGSNLPGVRNGWKVGTTGIAMIFDPLVTAMRRIDGGWLFEPV